jgi:uncharacterized small protein (DUF1192 family)
MISLILRPYALPGASLLTWPLQRSTLAAAMDEDDFFTSKPSDPLTLLVRQDLGPLSVDELIERMELLRQEISRIEQHLADTERHRNAADELFKK